MMKKVNNIFLKFFLPLLFFLCGVVSAFSEKHNKISMIELLQNCDTSIVGSFTRNERGEMYRHVEYNVGSNMFNECAMEFEFPISPVSYDIYVYDRQIVEYECVYDALNQLVRCRKFVKTDKECSVYTCNIRKVCFENPKSSDHAMPAVKGYKGKGHFEYSYTLKMKWGYVYCWKSGRKVNAFDRPFISDAPYYKKKDDWFVEYVSTGESSLCKVLLQNGFYSSRK